VITRKSAEAELHEAITGYGGAAIPRGREYWLNKRAEQLRKEALSRFNVPFLLRTSSRGSELTLTALRLMILVSKTMLMNRDEPAARLYALRNLARQAWRERPRDHGEVYRQVITRKHIEQPKQVIIFPPGVIISKEERNRLGRIIKRDANRV
jgi:hypothetical protein